MAELQAKEHEIKEIEEITCKLANTVGNALGRAQSINQFFFGVPTDSVKTKEDEPEPTGWFKGHVRVLRHIDDRVQDICDALGNIHEVVDKK